MELNNTHIKLSIHRIIFCLFFGLFGLGQSEIRVIDFECLYPDLSKTSTNAISAGYEGFQWSSTFRLMTNEYATSSTSSIGYVNGMAGSVVAYTSGPEGSNRVQLTSSTPFNFGGASITSAWKINQDVVVRGFYQGQMLYRTTIFTSCDQPYWFDFNFMGIDRLDIVPGTGGDDYYANYRGNHLAIDNITLIPEPASFAMFIFGCSLLWRKSRYCRQGK